MHLLPARHLKGSMDVVALQFNVPPNASGDKNTGRRLPCASGLVRLYGRLPSKAARRWLRARLVALEGGAELSLTIRAILKQVLSHRAWLI